LKCAAQNIRLAISEIQERMILLEATLRNNAMISSTLSIAELSTPKDISEALEGAVNGPVKDWTFGAKIIERFSKLHDKLLFVHNQIDNYSEMESDEFLKAVWQSHNFDSNVARLLRSGDILIVNKLLDSLNLHHSFGGELTISVVILNALASILIAIDDKKRIYL
jgi:hypothetical protein